jgi:hypothetical protein
MNLIAYAVVGRLLIWVWQTSGPTTRIWKLHPFLTEQAECDFCVGCWVYIALAFVFQQNFLAPVYVPVLSEFVTGLIASFVAHIASIGWRSNWGYITLRQ